MKQGIGAMGQIFTRNKSCWTTWLQHMESLWYRSYMALSLCKPAKPIIISHISLLLSSSFDFDKCNWIFEGCNY